MKLHAFRQHPRAPPMIAPRLQAGFFRQSELLAARNCVRACHPSPRLSAGLSLAKEGLDGAPSFSNNLDVC